jgi:hypothetical protein
VSDYETIPLLTSFDALEGSFGKLRRARLVLICAVGAAAIAATSIAGLGLLAQVDTAALELEYLDQEQVLDQLTAELGSNQQTGGLPARQVMTERVDSVGVEVARAAQSDLPVSELMLSIRNVTPGEVEITSVALVPEGGVTKLKISASVTGFQAPLAWEQGLRNLPALESVKVTADGSKAELEAELSSAAVTGRAVSFRELYAPNGFPTKTKPTAEETKSDTATGKSAKVDDLLQED